MKILSKILLSLLMLLSLNSFAKGKVCSQNPEDLINNLNFAYEKRDGGTIYDLLSKKTALIFESKVKNRLKFILPYLSKQAKNLASNKAIVKTYELSLALSKSSNREFFVNLYKMMVSLKIPIQKTLRISFLSSKMNGNSGIVRIKYDAGKEQEIPVIKKEDCLKLNLSEKDLNIFSRKK